MICILLIFTAIVVTGCQSGGAGDSVVLQPTSLPAAVGQAPAAASPTPQPPEPTGPLVIIGDDVFIAEVADTTSLRVRGLSGRPSLPGQTGMLFVFGPGGTSAFWMRDMQFPLDFVWIGEDCTVVDITKNVPNPDPGTPDSDLPTYSSGVPSTYAFEINAGEVEDLGIQVGDEVRFSGISSEGADC